ncbi:hypothetical protein HDV00_008656 [Rhizophlyctis rosea]|nr:hypothetical protein HDV00_008656 [Rhizophlyctis rosea]
MSSKDDSSSKLPSQLSFVAIFKGANGGTPELDRARMKMRKFLRDKVDHIRDATTTPSDLNEALAVDRFSGPRTYYEFKIFESEGRLCPREATDATTVREDPVQMSGTYRTGRTALVNSTARQELPFRRNTGLPRAYSTSDWAATAIG